VRLEYDRRLGRTDRYGRRLAYVFWGRENVNRAVVLRGAASVWFYRGEKGRYARTLERAARLARAKERGLWAACPGTRYDPERPLETRRARNAGGAGCDPNYTGACVPRYERVGDVDCADVRARVRIVGSDPHSLDGRDDDGWGCESYG
jgi:micrococcal nuclease